MNTCEKQDSPWNANPPWFWNPEPYWNSSGGDQLEKKSWWKTGLLWDWGMIFKAPFCLRILELEVYGQTRLSLGGPTKKWGFCLKLPTCSKRGDPLGLASGRPVASLPTPDALGWGGPSQRWKTQINQNQQQQKPYRKTSFLWRHQFLGFAVQGGRAPRSHGGLAWILTSSFGDVSPLPPLPDWQQAAASRGCWIPTGCDRYLYSQLIQISNVICVSLKIIFMFTYILGQGFFFFLGWVTSVP